MEANTIELNRLALPSGGGRCVEADVELPTLEVGRESYRVVDGPTRVRLDVSRTSSGWAFRLRFEVTVSGPCTRCLADSRQEISVDLREVQEAQTDEEELSSPYVEEDVLDLAGWARDGLVLSMPTRYLCHPGCEGLCPVCGEPLRSGAHEHGADPDPRWEKLGELRLD